MKSAYLALLLSFSCATFAQAASKKTSARKKPAAVKVLNAKKGSRRVAAVPRQALPSADRYKEIQQALASKGYLKSEPTGVWDAHSVDAMRQFQSDRKLDPSGKLTAASLIDLGLGPKHEISHPAVSGTVEPVADLPRAEQAPAPQP